MIRLVMLASLLVVTACRGANDGVDATKLAVRAGALGSYVVDGSGRSVYSFSGDAAGQSACLTNCATVWPPVAAAEDTPQVDGIDAALVSFITRPDGSRQLTFAGRPLYYASSDQKAGDTWGHYAMSFGGRFTLVSPAGQPVPGPR